MTITFGLALDDPAFPLPEGHTGGWQALGPMGLLQFLEGHLGLTGHARDNDYLRIEQYRQALRSHLEDNPGAFFRAAFEADQFATATDLLSRRDELLLGGWSFAGSDDLPPRLSCLADLEKRMERGTPPRLAPGYADRFAAVLQRLRAGRPPLSLVQLCEPRECLPAHLLGLFRRLQELGVTVAEALQDSDPAPATDLGLLQAGLRNTPGPRRRPLTGDGSLLILRGKRESDLAAFLAALLRRNTAFRPVFLVPDKNRALDNAIGQEGLPSLGIPSASLARPTLQVLKLVTVFLWHPLDPFKVMEFVSLSVKPLDDELANRIAQLMAQTPGIQGESWQRTIGTFFAQSEERAQRDPSIDIDRIRFQYRFWFLRPRFDSNRTAPKEEVIDIFSYLERWARLTFEENNGKNPSLLVLLDQARRIRELLETLPETQLTRLELERIVRTIYEPAPVQMQKQEKGRLPFVYQPHALIGPLDELVWWNFVQREPAYFFSRWYQSERLYLEKHGIHLESPDDENNRLIWQRRQPVLRTRNRLVLTIPEFIDGSPVLPHPLLGDLEARFGDLTPITCDLLTGAAEGWRRQFDLPQQSAVNQRRLGRPAPFLTVSSDRGLHHRAEETFSSLDALFYYPYQWVFRHKLLLRKSPILSIVPDATLMGNLAHRFFEQLLLEPDVQRWTQGEIDGWIDGKAAELLEREGAVLLLYGREPERIGFLKRIKFAAWSLINLIRNNGWTVAAAEHPIEGHFDGVPLNARADLVLQRGEEYAVIDFKWRGASRRERMIKNEEDLQLVLYANLLTSDQNWAHSAYFILESGRLISRTNHAFREITPLAPDTDPAEVNQRILDRMYATYRWRMHQISQGRIEVRCAITQPDLEAEYGEVLLHILEMKKEDAPFDDYRTLINLVQ